MDRSTLIFPEGSGSTSTSWLDMLQTPASSLFIFKVLSNHTDKESYFIPHRLSFRFFCSANIATANMFGTTDEDHFLTQLSLLSIPSLSQKCVSYSNLPPPPLGPVRLIGQHHLQKGETNFYLFFTSAPTFHLPVLMNFIYIASFFEKGQEGDLKMKREKTGS